ncbi:single-stranded DNA-binding protein [Lactobacillus hamsteri]|uniref:Single-stranded DNA-binding protein n=1 Tax=Lactobacillus hamsteri DSM 5661 = JCM 6256 TaxID=1423754 RepID=A0A0R1YBF2_9LACO|nr:single-stranded DNA-binding protein [Lactobacillus hamsteri]KRM37017.1 single-stranded DNA-binding protein [Lactobacillus hamsteri DSM 5661 = JCM 6256]
MINRTVLTGRLSRDPELRKTGSGISVATFTLAVDRQFTNAQGERGADFISCVIWRKAAENFANFTNKGSLVGVDGRIQTRSYDDKDGKRVYVTEVVVDNFSLLESRKDRENRNSDSGQNSNSGNSNSDPFAGNTGDSIDISDDDLPF